MKYPDRPIRQKLMIAIVGTSGLAVLLSSLAFISYQWINTRGAILESVDAAMAIISSNSTAALSFNDYQSADLTLSALKATPEIRIACIYTNVDSRISGPFASFSQDDSARACPIKVGSNSLSVTKGLLTRSMPIRIEDEVIGTLYIERSLRDFWQTMFGYALLLLFAVLVGLVMAYGMSELLQKVLAFPILTLSLYAGRVSATKDFSIRVPQGNQDEVGQLITDFNDMLSQIGTRDKALEQAKLELEQRVAEVNSANTELQSTLEKLRLTQEQLVQTEKMASLGGLVAGIAHEINTPIGVGVTAASTLQSKTMAMSRDYTDNKLTNTGLQRYIDLATQSSEIILSNLNRAAELIQSFKQVAVDQSSSEYRSFPVRQYLQEVLLSLKPKLKKTRLEVVIDCDSELQINSYPGAIAQIVTNLVMNSIVHAYDPEETGTLTIKVTQEAEKLHLRYSDDGRGMSPEHASKVFDPFFTTRRGTGGSGLGMHIVFNLVHQQLNGTVTLKSKVGEGTIVDIHIPTSKEV